MRQFFLTILATFIAGSVEAQEGVPAPGCYERVYGSEHFRVHQGQIIDRVWAFVDPKGKHASFPYSVHLKFFVKGYSKSTFETGGACASDETGILCNADSSAEERSICKNKRDGVRSCRIDLEASGKFRAASATGGMLISIIEQLKVGSSFSTEGYDYLYLSPSNPENHSFLLKPAPEKSCR